MKLLTTSTDMNLTPVPKQQDFCLDKVSPMPMDSFPNQPRSSGNSVPATIPNLIYMLEAYGISIRYDVIKKRIFIAVPGLTGSPENNDSTVLTQIISLATLNGMQTGQIPAILEAIADRNLYNPVADWIALKPWDGTDRLQLLYDTLCTEEDFPKELKELLIRRWLISAEAAVYEPNGFRTRGVLTLCGPQSIGKTTWFSALIDDVVLRERLIKTDHHLDPSNKDTLISAITHWIVEIGELDSSFKKDVARLKGYLTSPHDKIRRPYGRTDSEYPRRTIFCATVNAPDFLVDSTGNTRWWVIPVTSINYHHGLDMQQVWAQVKVLYDQEEQWWLTPDEEKLLESFNKYHMGSSVIRDRLLEKFDLERIGEDGLEAMTATQVLNEICIDKPSNPQCRECGAILREFLGQPKKIQGVMKWRPPFKKDNRFG